MLFQPLLRSTLKTRPTVDRMIQNDAWMRAGGSVHITRPSITITCERSPSHLTLTDSSHQPQRRSPSGHQPRQIVSHRRTFPPKFRNQFSAARDSSQRLSSSVLGASLPRSQVPSHEYGDVARVSAPPAAARRPGRRRSAGSPRTHSCRSRHDNGTAATLGSFDIDVLINSQCLNKLLLGPSPC